MGLKKILISYLSICSNSWREINQLLHNSLDKVVKIAMTMHRILEKQAYFMAGLDLAEIDSTLTDHDCMTKLHKKTYPIDLEYP